MKPLLVFSALLPCVLGQELQFATLGDFRLESGETIENCRIGYRTFGKLNQARSNAVLFPTWFTGTTEALRDQHIGPGRLADSSRYFVIAVDALGNGVSTSPSNSATQPRMRFPKFTIGDMVRSQHALLTRHLNLSRLHAVIGISMGGMQAFQWTVTFPEFLSRAVPIVGTPQQTATDLLLWNAELAAIEGDREWAGGDYSNPPALRALLQIHSFALNTPAYRAAQTPAAKFPAYLKEVEKGAGRFDANNWIRQLQAMIAHDIAAQDGGSLEAAARRIQARLFVVAALQDHMVNPTTALELARYLVAPTLELSSDCGHLAVGCESARISAAVQRFLSQ